MNRNGPHWVLILESGTSMMQVGLSTGVPTVWQGVRNYIQQLVKQLSGVFTCAEASAPKSHIVQHRPIISLMHREQGVDLLRPQLALKRLTCGGSAPQPELMRWFLEKSLGGDTVQDIVQHTADLTGTQILTDGTDMCKPLLQYYNYKL